MAKTKASDARRLDPCRHLGLNDSPAQRQELPSSSHRCYLWQQRDEIDLGHQREYCFTPKHASCPWLLVPPTGQQSARHRPRTKRRLVAGSGLLATISAIVALLTPGVPANGLGLSGWLSSSGFSGTAGRASAISAPLAATQSGGQVAENSAQVSPPQVVPSSPLTKYQALTPSLLNASNPEAATVRLATASGGTVVAGNIGMSFSPASLAGLGNDVTVTVQPHPNVIVPGGPAQFSPNGTLADISVRDAGGKLITTFADPVEILFKYNSADLAMARGDPGILTAAYVLDEESPALENPLHFPVGTWVFFPPSLVKGDAGSGTISVRTQAIGSVFCVVANAIGYAQTLKPGAVLYSSFDVDHSAVFGAKKQFSYLRIMEPQIGSRLLVTDPDTGNYAYVDAKDVGPSGPPPTSK